MPRWIQLKLCLLVLGSIALSNGCSIEENVWSLRIPTVDDPGLITGPGTFPTVTGKELFITVKVITTNTPSTTWIQFSKWNYSDKAICQQAISKSYEGIKKATAVGLGNEFLSMLGAGCMTFKDAAALNSDLGH